jgi:hypothetical protein
VEHLCFRIRASGVWDSLAVAGNRWRGLRIPPLLRVLPASPLKRFGNA